MKTTCCLLLMITISYYARAQGKVVDDFKIKKQNIEVIFYDPFPALIAMPGFQGKTDEEKSDLLDNYLHNNPLYLFKAEDKSTKDVTWLCIRGNPEKTETEMFFKVEVIKGITTDEFNPFATDYSDKIVKVIDAVNCGGTLFENMEMFAKPENKKYVGDGIQFWGYYRRVTPYEEIKTSMTSIIEQL